MQLNIPEGLKSVAKIYLTLPSPPILNHLYGISRNGVRYKKPAHTQYVTNVQKLCRVQYQGKPLTTSMYVELRWYRPRRSGDIDSCLKTMLDAMQGFIYENDSKIDKLLITRDYDKERPRMEVMVVSL